MKRALLLLALVALPAQAQHKPWYMGTQGTGATQWTPPMAVESGFPVSAVRTSYGSTITATITTAGASTLVAVVGGVGQGSLCFPFTSVAGGTGLTTAWTRISGASANWGSGARGTDVWYAITNAAQAAQVITATAGNGETQLLGFLSVYSITNANASPIGASAALGVAASTLNQVTVNAQAGQSIIVGGSVSLASASVITAYSFNSPWAYHYEDGSNALAYAAGHGNTSAAGNQIFGSTNTATNVGTGAVEIKR